ncbi:DMT family transporter [Devosia sp. ZW T5_3]|uniref:DMT family transporter n=1 Tax=Devosia sp. ZW T5_3 TaxID=3378085 RepID=UPI0038548C6C
MSRPLAALTLLFCTMLWGFAFVAQKSAMDAMGPLTFSGTRFIIGGLLIVPLALRELRRTASRPTARQWQLVALMCAVFFAGSILQQYGLMLTTVTNSGFLTGLYVFFVPVIGLVAARIVPHPIIWFCAPIALLGIYLLNGGNFDSFNLGDALIIACAVFWALHVLLLGHLATATGLPILLSVVTFLSVGIISAVLAVPIEAPDFASISNGWVQIAYSACFSTAVAFTGQAIAQQYLPAANAAIILSAESLFAALGGALILGERLPPIGYLGAALIFLAILLVETVPPLWARRRVS